MTEKKTVLIRVSREVWQHLRLLKEQPGDSFDKILKKELGLNG